MKYIQFLSLTRFKIVFVLFVISFVSNLIFFLLVNNYKSREFLSQSLEAQVLNLLLVNKSTLQEGNYRKFLENLNSVKKFSNGVEIDSLILKDFISGREIKTNPTSVWRCVNSTRNNYLTLCLDISENFGLQFIFDISGYNFKGEHRILRFALSYNFIAIGLITFLTLILITIYSTNLLSFVEKSLSGRDVVSSNSDYWQLSIPIQRIWNRIDELNQITEQQTEAKSRYEISRKVAHDIRSPLSALNVLAKNSSELEENKHRLLTSAIDRISSIANELMAPSGSLNPRQTNKVEMIDFLLTSILNEKRLEYQEKPIKFVVSLSYGCFSYVNSSQFKATISNLINNSVEAGALRIDLQLKSRDKLELLVEDDGAGIPPQVLSMLGKGRISTKTDGHGIGLSSAVSAIESWGGKIDIQSVEGKGTSIHIELPRSEGPEWFVSKLELGKYAGIVVCDDDESIHSLFDMLFEGQEVVHFNSILRIKEEFERLQNFLVFLDNEFKGESLKGIDLIQGIPNGILMSGNVTESLLASVAEKKVRFIPKSALDSERFLEIFSF